MLIINNYGKIILINEKNNTLLNLAQNNSYSYSTADSILFNGHSSLLVQSELTLKYIVVFF